jgi:hypothetical protein
MKNKINIKYPKAKDKKDSEIKLKNQNKYSIYAKWNDYISLKEIR